MSEVLTFKFNGTELEASADGRTVWVNSHRCLARFGRNLREFYYDEFGGSSVIHKEEPVWQDWASFCDEVFKHWKVRIPEHLVPNYIKKPNSPFMIG